VDRLPTCASPSEIEFRREDAVPDPDGRRHVHPRVQLLAAGSSLTGRRVAELLDGIATERGYPETITVDNGTEFYSNAMDSWAYQRGVQLQLIRPGKPVENAFIESSTRD
jgi:transposase InsO family protein